MNSSDRDTYISGTTRAKLMLWGGMVIIGLVILMVVIFYLFDPQLLQGPRAEIAVALGVVAGSTLTTLGLHSSGKIGKVTLDRTTLALAVSAIVFAVWQFGDARLQESRMEQLSKQMSTRFSGTFPKNIRDIDEIVPRANRSLDIMADFVGYGHYSAPEDFSTYLRAIEDLRSKKNLPVRMLVYTRKKGGEIHDTQFTAKAYDTAKNERSQRLVDFCRKFNNDRIPSSKEEFDKLLFARQRDYIQDLTRLGVRIRVTENELPFFMWDEDDQEAVFSFLNEDLPPEANAREVSFRTADAGLIIGAFKVRFCKLWNQANDVELTADAWIGKATDHKTLEDCAIH